MTWTLQFYPYDKKETVGTAAAHFDDGVTTFDFKGSVNLDDAGSVSDFIAQAHKAQTASVSSIDQTNLDNKVSALLNGLNK